MHALLKSHLEVVCQILRYLKATLGKGVLLKKGRELKMEATQMQTGLDLIWIDG